MWQRLKECKTAREIYKTLEPTRLENNAEKLLCLWCLLPVFALEWHYVLVYWRSKGLWSSFFVPDFWQGAMHLLGILTFLLAAVVVMGRLAFDRNHVLWMLKKEPWHFLLLGMLLWSVMSTVLCEDPERAFKGSAYMDDGLRSYFFYAAVMVAGFLITSQVKQQKVMEVFSLTANVNALLMMMQEWEVPVLADSLSYPRSGIFCNANHLAYYLSMSILCLAGLYLYEESTRKRVLLALSMALQVYALIVNDTFGCYLAVVVGIAAAAIFYVCRKGRWSHCVWVPIGIVLVLSACSCLGWIPSSSGRTLWDNFMIFFYDVNRVAENVEEAGSAGSGRVLLWMTALEMIPERPLFGYGPEMLYGEYARITGFDRPHNEYIQHAVFLGIPALIMYLAALITMFIHQWKHLPKLQESTIIAAGAVVAYLFSALFGNTMFYTTPYFFMLLGFAAGRPKA